MYKILYTPGGEVKVLGTMISGRDEALSTEYAGVGKVGILGS